MSEEEFRELYTFAYSQMAEIAHSLRVRRQNYSDQMNTRTLVGEVFVKFSAPSLRQRFEGDAALTEPGGLQPETMEKLKALFITVADRTLLDYLRKKRRYAQTMLPGTGNEECADVSPGALTLSLEAERRNQAEAALADLRANHEREYEVLMRKMEGEPYEQIAAALGISKDVAKKSRQKGLRFLQKKVDGSGGLTGELE